ncbi:arsenate reductase (glutaredoxin) [Williamsia serinedens]|uniref:arsenate reductase (glutathione/glutaredoxin) n=1 Tax=Williamsia serinedens TaxID=391736 RepID=A0ABT1GZT2_9NOCA|nr:arsenate reductase (glutaredoxin) [Williamsia serinedens]MCP2160505.1 arsenate reductase [Williamsia serinedens]
MAARIFHNPQCSTSRKTLQRLRDAGVEPEIVQYLTTPPTRDELARMISDAGLTPSQAVRRREALFTELSLADADDDALLDAMAENPRLVERPFVVTDKGTRLARPVEKVDEIL